MSETEPKIIKPGRPVGSDGKKNQRIQFLADELGCDPAKILMLVVLGRKEELGEEKDIDLDRKISAAESLLPYLHGKRKPVDSQGDDSESLLSVFLGQINDRD